MVEMGHNLHLITQEYERIIIQRLAKGFGSMEDDLLSKGSSRSLRTHVASEKLQARLGTVYQTGHQPYRDSSKEPTNLNEHLYASVGRIMWMILP